MIAGLLRWFSNCCLVISFHEVLVVLVLYILFYCVGWFIACCLSVVVCCGCVCWVFGILGMVGL